MLAERHWIIAYNELTDELRFMELTDEWLPFKYNVCADIAPDWTAIGFYETLYDALAAVIK